MKALQNSIVISMQIIPEKVSDLSELWKWKDYHKRVFPYLMPFESLPGTVYFTYPFGFCVFNGWKNIIRTFNFNGKFLSEINRPSDIKVKIKSSPDIKPSEIKLIEKSAVANMIEDIVLSPNGNVWCCVGVVRDRYGFRCFAAEGQPVATFGLQWEYSNAKLISPTQDAVSIVSYRFDRKDNSTTFHIKLFTVNSKGETTFTSQDFSYDLPFMMDDLWPERSPEVKFFHANDSPLLAYFESTKEYHVVVIEPDYQSFRIISFGSEDIRMGIEGSLKQGGSMAIYNILETVSWNSARDEIVVILKRPYWGEPYRVCHIWNKEGQMKEARLSPFPKNMELPFGIYFEDNGRVFYVAHFLSFWRMLLTALGIFCEKYLAVEGKITIHE